MRIAKSFLLLVVAAALVALPAGSAFAADALVICQSGVPFAYPGGGANILWNPDLGGLGPLTNAQAVAAVDAAFDRWENISTASATFFQGPPVAVDIDVTNFVPIFNGLFDGESPIVFDEDGSIFNLLFGPGSGILGFAGPEFGNFATCELLEGSAWLNGPEFNDPIVAEDIMVHEFGHYINLGHVELNGQLVNFSEGGDTSGPTPDNSTFGTPAFVGTEVIETMYPFYFGTTPSGGAGTRTPHADDIASISMIYPDPSFAATTGAVSGTIYAPDGTTRLSGVNVIARNLADPFVDSVSTFSGAYTDSTSQADPNVGTYTLSNLTPGATYAVFVDQVTALAGRFSNPILGSLPGPEEYWNGVSESSDPMVDDPLVFVGIVAAAGTNASGTDIIFNQPPPGQIPLGDDDFVEIFMPFAFEICGQSFSSVFVNANGNLTFGSGDTDFSESAAEMLNDQPRIAGLWDDLNPSQGGTVSYSQSANTFSVRYENIPEWFNSGANTFEITLNRSSNHVDIAYENVSIADGLAGVSCGSAITSRFEAPSDLSAFAPSRINLKNQPASYEVFGSGNANDLAYSTVRFNGTTNYNDTWAEPNNSIGKARNIKLPFDSIPIVRYTEIEPAGADVDYYGFSAQGGTTLLAEVLTGQIDSLIGLFDSAGNLLAVDDDGGSGFLSKIQFAIPADGKYYLAVTTWPDFGFTGDGNTDPVFGQGRYVLDLFAVQGVLLNLGDDTSVNVGLGFTFPFQGSSYTDVWVNSNGNLTFGSGDTDFSESVSELLNDQPRIAALWDDLSPNNAGQVIVDSQPTSWTVSFIDVPEFVSTGANNFSITLEPSGQVTLDYGSVTALDGIVGVTEGGGAANPGETDFSAGGAFSAVGTTYEQFTGGGDPFDLSGQTLVFTNP